jgi:putative ABC transport system substrate-binding protein
LKLRTSPAEPLNHRDSAQTAGVLKGARCRTYITDAGGANAPNLVFQQRGRVGQLALAHRLPLGVWSKETFDGGALLSYGPDQVAMCRRAPALVDKILKGAKPGDLPVEQPTKLELYINLKVARDLDLSVPTMLLALADELIE